MEQVHEEKPGLIKILKSIEAKAWFLILTLLFVGSGQLAVVGMAGNLLTKKYHVSDQDAGGIMGRYQIITGAIKPFAVILAYYFGSRAIIICVSSIISSIVIFVIAESGASEADLVKGMMIVLPVMTGLYYPVFFNGISLATTEKNVAVAMSFCIVVAGLGQAVIPTTMGIISDKQTPSAYSNAY